MPEHWKTIEEFPQYMVNNYGDVMHITRERLIQQSKTQSGAVKVGLYLHGTQQTRSVKVLVAAAFVAGRNELFNTPIHLDNDPENNTADNLVWRPRWFAWKYAQQFHPVSQIHFKGPILEVESDRVYDSVYDVGVVNGYLFADVWRSTRSGEHVFPHTKTFKVVR